MNQITASSVSSVTTPILTLASQSSPAQAWVGAQNLLNSQGSILTNPVDEVTDPANHSSYEPTLLEDTLTNLNAQIADMRSRMAGTANAVAALSALQSRNVGSQGGQHQPFTSLQAFSSPPPNMGVTLSDTLHGVPQYLVDLAASGAYMDLVLCLPQNLPRLPASKPSESDFDKLKSSLPKISSYETWLEAFIAYTSILVISRPDKVLLICC